MQSDITKDSFDHKFKRQKTKAVSPKRKGAKKRNHDYNEDSGDESKAKATLGMQQEYQAILEGRQNQLIRPA